MPIFNENYIYLLINGICKLYLGHIVNIFLIWTGTLVKLNKFIAKIKKSIHQLNSTSIIQATV